MRGHGAETPGQMRAELDAEAGGLVGREVVAPAPVGSALSASEAVDERVEFDPFGGHVEQPVEGQEWLDGLTPGFSWIVSWFDESGSVWLNLVDPVGEVTGSYMRWPVNRWAALVAKQRLTLKVGE